MDPVKDIMFFVTHINGVSYVSDGHLIISYEYNPIRLFFASWDDDEIFCKERVIHMKRPCLSEVFF